MYSNLRMSSPEKESNDTKFTSEIESPSEIHLNSKPEQKMKCFLDSYGTIYVFYSIFQM
jgi:hypothetical protein